MTFIFPFKQIMLAIFALSLLLSAGHSYAHSGPINKGAILSCDDKERSNACQYTGGHNDLYIGTCRYRNMTGDDLICVRTEPIRKADPNIDDSEHEHKDSTPKKPTSELTEKVN